MIEVRAIFPVAPPVIVFCTTLAPVMVVFAICAAVIVKFVMFHDAIVNEAI